MPRPSRNPQEVIAVQREILDQATILISQDGVDALSMRKIAKAMNMTAANLYNYFENREELILYAQARGYEMLFEAMDVIFQQDLPTLEKGRAMMEQYLQFGDKHAHYYDLMFGITSPRYVDYVGTKLENIAYAQKEVALKVADIATLLISEMGDKVYNTTMSKEEAHLYTVKVWCGLHGLVCLRHSRFLGGQEGLSSHVVKRILDDLITPLEKNLQK